VDSLKRGKILIEFDRTNRILTTFAEMLKIGFGMKKHIPFTGIWIAVVLLALMVACDPPKGDVVEPREKPLPELAAIDSLMWKQPDSAFAVLRQFAASPNADSLDEFNGHYCQLLISELLYKNYYGQSNREGLLHAVDYFDSIAVADGYKKDGRKTDSRGASLRERNVFLDARVHYINGVGFYEKGDVVKACAEYLKALELMEGYFEGKALIGKRAQFMANTYNRMGDLFSEQFMMESAITCYENALVYCKIELTSPIGISNILYRIGKQYDKMNEIDKARQYFEQALECMTDTNNLVYRDIVSSKAVSDYRYGVEIDQPLDELKQIVLLADNETERLYRCMTIGALFFEEGIYDSALYYLIPVFENTDNKLSQIQAAEYLRNVYDSIGEFRKADVCVRFLADNKKSEGENKALVSKLEDLFKEYMDQKQKKEAEEMREMSIKKTIGIIVPIAIVVALSIIVLAKLRSKKLLKEQQEEADRLLGETEQEHEKELKLWQAEADKTLEETKKRYEEELRQLKVDTEQQLEEVERKHQQWMAKTKERHEEELRAQKDLSEKEIEKTKKRHEEELETERLAYQKEQEALRQNLQQREAQVSALEKVLEQQSEEGAKRRAAFLNEEICQRILDLLHGKHITSRDTSFQHGIGLKEEDFKQLKDAVERHYKGFDNMLLSQCASLKQSDLTLCHLHLLGLNEGEIGALKDRTYSAIKKQNENLQEKIGVEEDIASYILRVAEGLCGTQNGTQGGTQTNEFLDDDLDAWIERQIKDNPKITTEELAEKSHKGVRTIKRHISMMGHIHYVGSGYSGYWEVSE
jgi:tetratricopeptide (TPR) repeat protein